MTLYIIFGIVISFGLYILFSKKSQNTNLQVDSNQHINNLQSHHNHNSSDHKKKHSCCG